MFKCSHVMFVSAVLKNALISVCAHAHVHVLFLISVCVNVKRSVKCFVRCTCNAHVHGSIGVHVL